MKLKIGSKVRLKRRTVLKNLAQYFNVKENGFTMKDGEIILSLLSSYIYRLPLKGKVVKYGAKINDEQRYVGVRVSNKLFQKNIDLYFTEEELIKGN